MINSLIEGFRLILEKPKILLPAVLVNLINFLIIVITYIAFSEFIVNTVIELKTANTQGFELLTYLIKTNPIEMVSIFIASLIVVMLNVSLIYFYALYVKEKKPIRELFSHSLKKWKEILTLIIFSVLVFSVANMLYALIVSLTEGITTILTTIILLLVFLFLYFKFFLFIPVMAINGKKLKEGLIEAWNFSNKHLLALFLLIIAVILVNLIIQGIEIILVDLLLDRALEIVSLIVVTPSMPEQTALLTLEVLNIENYQIISGLLFSSIAVTYTNLVFPLFYLTKK